MQTELNALNQRGAQLRRQAQYLALCPDTEVPRVFKDLLGSLEQLFAFEHRLMEQHRFPALRCHVEQHARALRGLHRTHSQVMCGAHHKGRYAGTHLLMNWFELHNETLDACLAAWLECLQSGHNTLNAAHKVLSSEARFDQGGNAAVPWQSRLQHDRNSYSNNSGQNGQSLGK